MFPENLSVRVDRSRSKSIEFGQKWSNSRRIWPTSPQIGRVRAELDQIRVRIDQVRTEIVREWADLAQIGQIRARLDQHRPNLLTLAGIPMAAQKLSSRAGLNLFDPRKFNLVASRGARMQIPPRGKPPTHLRKEFWVFCLHALDHSPIRTQGLVLDNHIPHRCRCCWYCTGAELALFCILHWNITANVSEGEQRVAPRARLHLLRVGRGGVARAITVAHETNFCPPPPEPSSWHMPIRCGAPCR